MSFYISEDTTIEDIYHTEDILNYMVGNVQYCKQQGETPAEEWITALREFIIEAKSILAELEAEINTL